MRSSIDDIASRPLNRKRKGPNHKFTPYPRDRQAPCQNMRSGFALGGLRRDVPAFGRLRCGTRGSAPIRLRLRLCRDTKARPQSRSGNAKTGGVQIGRMLPYPAFAYMLRRTGAESVCRISVSCLLLSLWTSSGESPLSSVYADCLPCTIFFCSVFLLSLWQRKRPAGDASAFARTLRRDKPAEARRRAAD
jgi:hypothetical protein